MLAGVAATGEDEVFSIISAGIFLSEISNKSIKLRSNTERIKGVSRLPSQKKILRCVLNP